MDNETGHVLEAWLELDVRDKNNNVVHYHRQKARSWVKNFFLFLHYGFRGSYPTLVKQDGSTATPAASFIYYLALTAESGNDKYGILVGSGDRPWSINDYALANKIANGSSTGQLLYGATSVEDIVVESNRIYFRVTRPFSNSSPSDVTVAEVALAIYFCNNNAIIARDVLTQPVVVAPGQTLTVRYIIQMTW